MTTRFDGKVALVTGGGSGIGRATALAFAREGAKVMVAGRTGTSLDETVRLIEAEGSIAGATIADVGDDDDVVRLVRTIVERFGTLDIAVNGAGVLPPAAPLGDVSTKAWDAAIATNLTGTFLSMKHEIGQMRPNGGGVIVNIASVLGAHMRIPWTGTYVATKAAVSALTRNAAREYIADGIRINAVSPGPIDTPMSLLPGESTDDRDQRMKEQLPAGRVGRVAEIAATVLWLASPESSFVVGQDIVVDGGAAA